MASGWPQGPKLDQKCQEMSQKWPRITYTGPILNKILFAFFIFFYVEPPFQRYIALKRNFGQEEMPQNLPKNHILRLGSTYPRTKSKQKCRLFYAIFDVPFQRYLPQIEILAIHLIHLRRERTPIF